MLLDEEDTCRICRHTSSSLSATCSWRTITSREATDLSHKRLLVRADAIAENTGSDMIGEMVFTCVHVVLQHAADRELLRQPDGLKRVKAMDSKGSIAYFLNKNLGKGHTVRFIDLRDFLLGGDA